MKKLTLVVLLIAAMAMISTPASAFTLTDPSYVGPVKFLLDGYTEHGTAAAPGETWAVVNVASICKTNAAGTCVGPALWSAGQDGEYINGILYGLTDTQVLGTGPVDIYQTGGVYAFYLANAQNQAGIGAGDLGPSSRVGNTFPTVTDGSAFFGGNLVPGVVAGDNVTTMLQSASSATVPASGRGLAYAEVLNGPYAYLFNSNSLVNGSDFRLEYSFTATSVFANNWDAVLDSASIKGSVVPEPTSMLLLGSGLIGLLGFRRKK